MNRRTFNKLILLSLAGQSQLFAEIFDGTPLSLLNIEKSDKDIDYYKLLENNIENNQSEHLITLPDNLEKIKNPNKNIEKINLNNKNFYLTIDDGYFYTKEIIQNATENNVILNMFIIGKLIQQNPKLWIQALEEGHLLGSHSYNHYQFSKHSYKEIKGDFKVFEIKTIQSIGKEHFNNIKYFRFPYGDEGNNTNKKDIYKLITQEYGWKISRWDLDLSFNHGKYLMDSFTLEEQVKIYTSYCENTKKKKNVLLFHFKKTDNLALKNLIEFGKTHNIKFLRLDDNGI